YATGLTDDGEFTRVRLAPEGVEAINFAFDITPAELIDGIITERGVIKPTGDEIAEALSC
ncbi:MAG: S-methyl-5-thioribose-1-phosphate isomerase, partial [Phycisphaerae bacterium]|nr:S-methyl-5-thioribose-1-phosphate isomerase [Phycisphaerae bacterium]